MSAASVTAMSYAPPAPPTPEQILAEAQALITAAGPACQVTEALQPGVDPEQRKIYEAVCAEGPGYILVAATPPQAFDCLELAGTAATARLRDPAADVGQQCLMPANQNGLAVIGGWARTAGVSCTIDQAIAIGKSDADNTPAPARKVKSRVPMNSAATFFWCFLSCQASVNCLLQHRPKPTGTTRQRPLRLAESTRVQSQHLL